MKIYLGPLCFLLLGLALLPGAGCAKSASEQAFDSDANGYVCAKCGERFYTERSVAAEFCPKCKAGEIEEVMAFVCPEDQQVILAPRSLQAAPCSVCGKLVKEVKLPQASELKAWGASGQEKDSVIGRR